MVHPGDERVNLAQTMRGPAGVALGKSSVSCFLLFLVLCLHSVLIILVNLLKEIQNRRLECGTLFSRRKVPFI